jgi:outer membrane protein TolC
MLTAPAKAHLWSTARTVALSASLGLLLGVSGCKSAAEHRVEADKVAADIIEAKQRDALGQTQPFTILTPADRLRNRLLMAQDLPITGPASLGSQALPLPEHWPEDGQPYADTPPLPPVVDVPDNPLPLRLSLMEALQIGARNSREYQSRKEAVFLTALDLDLQLDQFRNSYFGLLESAFIADHSDPDVVTGFENGGSFSIARRLESGARLLGSLSIDLANLLSQGGNSSIGVAADATVIIPLLRGAGRHIVTEPLTQAQRNVIYALWDFEFYKQTFAVQIANEYLSVLQTQDRLDNAAASYRRLIASARRSMRLAQAGRLGALQVAQARSNELSARESWINAIQVYNGALDRFKITLGLPTDAAIELDRADLQRLADIARKALGSQPDPSQSTTAAPADAEIVLIPPTRDSAGPMELDERRAIEIGLASRLDLRIAQGEVYDAQRGVVVAANALEAGLNIVGRASTGEGRTLGSAGLDDAGLEPENGFYSLGVELDLPWERTAERNAYRESYVVLERQVRDVQGLEDQVKLQVRSDLRALLQARESYVTQTRSVEIAQRRVLASKLFLEAGRPGVQIRDVLEAEDALLRAQNALTAALVNYRVAELQLQRDMGVLSIDERGIWREYDPNGQD